MIDEPAKTTDAVTAISQLGPLGVWSLLVWQVVRVVEQLREYVRAHQDSLVDEADHRRAEQAHWRAEAERSARQEALLRSLADRPMASRPTHR